MLWRCKNCSQIFFEVGKFLKIYCDRIDDLVLDGWRSTILEIFFVGISIFFTNFPETLTQSFPDMFYQNQELWRLYFIVYFEKSSFGEVKNSWEHNTMVFLNLIIVTWLLREVSRLNVKKTRNTKFEVFALSLYFYLRRNYLILGT